MKKFRISTTEENNKLAPRAYKILEAIDGLEIKDCMTLFSSVLGIVCMAVLEIKSKEVCDDFVSIFSELLSENMRLYLEKGEE